MSRDLAALSVGDAMGCPLRGGEANRTCGWAGRSRPSATPTCSCVGARWLRTQRTVVRTST